MHAIQKNKPPGAHPWRGVGVLITSNIAISHLNAKLNLLQIQERDMQQESNFLLHITLLRLCQGVWYTATI